MTLQERLTAVHTQSASLYLRRQELESQRQQLSLQAQQIEMEMMRLDGDERTLQALMDEAEKAPNG